MKVKVCRKCYVEQSIDNFYSYGRSNGTKWATCKTCHYEVSRKWARDNTEKKREYSKKSSAKNHSTRLKTVYGISLEQKYQIFLRQGMACAVCRGKESHCARKRTVPTARPEVDGWNVDHSHTTGAVRGILCSRCNTMLGLSKDSVETLKSAINYLSSGVAFTEEDVAEE